MARSAGSSSESPFGAEVAHALGEGEAAFRVRGLPSNGAGYEVRLRYEE